MRRLLFPFLSIHLLISCSPTPEMPMSYLPDHANWVDERFAGLAAPDGFLNLAGLYWMEPGEYTFGSDSANDLVFPADLPPVMGSFFVTSTRVLMAPAPEVEIAISGVPVMGATMVYDEGLFDNPVMTYQQYVWFVINRAGHIGVRLRDLQHPALEQPLDVPVFPVDYKWVVEATYTPYESPKVMRVDNVIGFTYEMEIPGQLQFELDGRELTLEPIVEGDEFFIIFSDETSAIETYGSGRYMYAEIPKSGNTVVLDFNKCYNPPCAFTDFATCLIPPKENRLALRIEAGEKDFHMPH